MYISIGKVSKLLGVSISSLRRWDQQDILTPSYKTPGGHRRYDITTILEMCGNSSSFKDKSFQDKVVGYARVSGHKQKKDLQSQIRSIRNYAFKRNYHILRIYSDIASGINDTRKNFITLLKSIPIIRPSKLIITYKDRLTRYGINVISLFCDLFGCDLVIIHDNHANKDPQVELVEGVIEVITSYAGRLHRQRRLVSTT